MSLSHLEIVLLGHRLAQLVAQFIRVQKVDDSVVYFYYFVSNPVNYIMYFGSWDAKHSGHNTIGCRTCQPKQEDVKLEDMTPAVVERTAEGMDKMGHCGSGEGEVRGSSSKYKYSIFYIGIQ